MGKAMDRFIAFPDRPRRSGKGNIVELAPPSPTEMETKRLTPLEGWFWVCSWPCFWIGLCLAVPAGFVAVFFIAFASCDADGALCMLNATPLGLFGMFIGPVVYLFLASSAIRLGKSLNGDWRGFPWT